MDNSKAIDSLHKTEQKTGKLGEVFGKVGKAAAVFGAALIAGFGMALVSGAKDAAEAEQKVAQLDAVLKSTGGAAGMTRDSLLSMAEGFEKTTKFSAEAALEAESLLLTFTNIGKDTFPMATQAAADMATAMGTDMAGQSIALGKALNDPVQGITALTRVGVSFTDQQKEQIKSMQESGDMAGAQAIILGELNKEFGGSALAAGQTFAGQLEIVKNGFGAITESLAMQFMPYLSLALAWIQENMPKIQEVFQAIFDYIKVAVDEFKIFWAENGDEIVAILSYAFELIKEVVRVGIDIVKGIIDVVMGLLSGDWKRVWEGLSGILDGAFALIRTALQLALDGLIAIIKGIAKTAWNAGADMFQSIWDGMKSVWTSLTSWVTEKIDWLTSKLKFWQSTQEKIGDNRKTSGVNGSHAAGLEYVPFDGYKAQLHKGERVLTAEENKSGSSSIKEGNTMNVSVNVRSPYDVVKELSILDKKLAWGL